MMKIICNIFIMSWITQVHCWVSCNCLQKILKKKLREICRQTSIIWVFFYLLSNSQKKQCFDFYLQRQPLGKIIELILIKYLTCVISWTNSCTFKVYSNKSLFFFPKIINEWICLFVYTKTIFNNAVICRNKIFWYLLIFDIFIIAIWLKKH